MPKNKPRTSGRFLVVGGQCSKVGKTALVVDLIRASPDLCWTAVKITPYAHSGCPVNGSGCPCGPALHTFAVRQENDRSNSSDSSRFLSAGAARSFWVQTKAGGGLAAALGRLANVLQGARGLIIESNAIVEFWQPDVLLLVLDPLLTDFKASALRLLPSADLFVFRSPSSIAPRAPLPIRARDRTRQVFQRIGHPLPVRLQNFVRQPLRALRHPT